MGRKELFHGTTQFYILLMKNVLWTFRKSVLVTGGMHPAEPTQLFSPALRVEIEESVNPGFQHPGSLVIDLSFLYVPIVVFIDLYLSDISDI